ncbi:hypothetical protein BB558_007485 [Smittium angustum]|uniref:Uncharacterized protein n=1 Tax=Smittium angustum TaxID=133377 RepID=A0A2U1IUX1_SMIAN|nr:hypothetical protein BB558_007485 [Smittium angustum]
MKTISLLLLPVVTLLGANSMSFNGYNRPRFAYDMQVQSNMTGIENQMSQLHCQQNYGCLTQGDIEPPLKLLASSAKTGCPTEMKKAVDAALGGLDKGPARLAEFFTLFNRLLLANKGVLDAQVVRGSGLITASPDGPTAMAQIYSKSFIGNEDGIADVIVKIFEHLKVSHQGIHGFTDTIKIMIDSSSQKNIRKCGCGYTPLASAISELESSLAEHYGCRRNLIETPSGRRFGKVIDSAISGDRESIEEFIRIIVEFETQNTKMFKGDLIRALKFTEKYTQILSKNLRKVFLALIGQPDELDAQIRSITRFIVQNKKMIKCVFNAYKTMIGNEDMVLEDLLLRFMASFFIILCMFWVPFCCCC